MLEVDITQIEQPAMRGQFYTRNQDGATICMVTHDPASAKRASRCLEMFDGRLIADNLNTPSHQSPAPAVAVELVAS